MGSSYYDKVLEFHKTFKLDVVEDYKKSIFKTELKEKWREKLRQEFEEFVQETVKRDVFVLVEIPPQSGVSNIKIEGVAKELAELVYVAIGNAIALGIDFDAAFNEIHEANMRRLWNDGKPHFDDEGEIVNPVDWAPPDLRSVLKLD